MSDLQDLIATQTIRAYNQGANDQRDRIIKAIENRICFDHKSGQCDHSVCYGNTELVELLKGGRV